MEIPEWERAWVDLWSRFSGECYMAGFLAPSSAFIRHFAEWYAQEFEGAPKRAWDTEKEEPVDE